MNLRTTAHRENKSSRARNASPSAELGSPAAAAEREPPGSPASFRPTMKERWIGKCLESIRTAMERGTERYEVIVVDDGSIDSTRQIAEQMGACTLRVEHRRISAVRNAGARAACGEL
jgi:cellulose synthase/poly-beta-1,6-N-acetylglucosamine synthase-like glycosyltransferase